MTTNTETNSPPVTADDLLRGLVNWLEGQPGETTYCWTDYHDCLFTRYGGTLDGGRLHNLVGGEVMESWELQVAMPKPHTYAAALTRARALL
jgi:hypothetical protein